MINCLIHVLVQLILFFQCFSDYEPLLMSVLVLLYLYLQLTNTVLLCIILILWSVLFLTPKPPPFIPIKQGLLILCNPYYHLILVSKADLYKYKIRRNIDTCVGNRNRDHCLNQPKCMRTMIWAPGTSLYYLLLVF